MQRSRAFTLGMLVVFLCGTAVAGKLHLKIRDSLTHHPIQAHIEGNGPQKFSIRTDTKGIANIELADGEYIIDVRRRTTRRCI